MVVSNTMTETYDPADLGGFGKKCDEICYCALQKMSLTMWWAIDSGDIEVPFTCAWMEEG
jgi:hypothetical protein